MAKFLCMGGPMHDHYETVQQVQEGHVVNFLEPGVGWHQYELCGGLLLYRGLNGRST